MRNLTKKQKKDLRALAEKAYEEDLGRCIDKLFDHYQEWKNKQISVWDLNEKIHEFHNDIARGLYKSYTIEDPIFPVAFGIKSGVIGINEVDQYCHQDIERILEYLENNNSNKV